MKQNERIKLLVRSRLFYLAVSMFVVGLVIMSFFQKKDSGLNMFGAILGQGAVILGFLAYRKTRFTASPGNQTRLQQQRSSMGVILVLSIICVGLLLTPIVLKAEIPNMSGFILWYSVGSAIIGLIGLIGLFIWFRRSSH